MILIAAAIVQAMGTDEEPETKGLDVGNKAPSFSLQSLQGEKIALSDYKGKTVVLNFWATWCPPCKKEMPDLEQFYQDYQEDLVVLSVNTDPTNDVQGFVNDMNLTFPVVLDDKSEVSHQYEILSIPTTYVIDNKGNIQQKHIGELTYEQMVNLVKK